MMKISSNLAIKFFKYDYDKLLHNIYVISTESQGGLSMDYLENIPYKKYEKILEIRDIVNKNANTKKPNENSDFNPNQIMNKFSGLSKKFK